MKKICLLTACFVCCLTCIVIAQSPYVYKAPEKKLWDSALVNRLKQKQFVDSLKQAWRYQRHPYSNMPLAGSMPKRFNYIGNNQQGFDIYQTPYDNLYILKPDSTFSSTMPVLNSLQMQIKPVEIPNPQKERRQ
ncbi:hypothetical protein FRZ67_00590 [Panacibacter ginsenosidivorans]|uniref:Uncharacterized protein n=1 Tax=Panacibacter ginsenosidivorans TaxID=1813871 RepID=A0A5B8V373_9BACT|nr:hypothetical protein [Panacibacter ginsenosidivorans]QEC65870.1 hypothetical protein FRZ67_00590 [Panacibacter ginsenosidivorans]